MGKNIIASDSIVLTPVKDGLTISMSPASCSISADFNGGNQNIDKAFTDLNLFLGPKQLDFTLSVVEISDTRIKYSITNIDSFTKRFRLTSVPTDILTGHVKFEFKTSYGETTGGTFQFTVIRDVNTLDWIKDWENNKTKIGGDYLITPQIFVGKKVTSESQMSVLTGVYIGPEGIAPNSSAGIYGYKTGKEIFHINETGGSIGGWDINKAGIQTEDGKLRILSEGSVVSYNDSGEAIWGLYKTGEAIFAAGNVKLHADGSAYFKGEITSSSGKIGGWTIDRSILFSEHILLDSTYHYIGLSPFQISGESDVSGPTHKAAIISNGGVAISYTNANSYGVVGYLPGRVSDGVLIERKTFSVGSDNVIAGWMFDEGALWRGLKSNTAKTYTANSNSITIGSSGMRGYGWYIDMDGEISFVNGLVAFNNTGGTLVGWNITSQRLSTNKVALVSDSSCAGLYLSVANTSGIASSSLADNIQKNGGVYLKADASDTVLSAYKANGGVAFYLSAVNVNTIAGWSFNETAIYSGSLSNSGFTTKSGDITIGVSGIRGFKWRFETDGSGALAGGNISWNSSGAVTFSESVSLSWTTGIQEAKDSANTANTNYTNLLGTYLTKIGVDGIYTGTLTADNITSGTISTANIRNKAGTWFLNQDGSGSLANGNISWDEVGNVEFTGKITAIRGEIGGFTIGDHHIGSTASETGGGGSLSIYSNFIRVGGENGHVLIGDNVIPATGSMFFKATARIVNKAINTGESFGLDTANYGIFIDVTNGTKNYGISSNAALKAPAFINTTAKILTFSDGNYSVDFSQHNIILMYYNDPNYSGTIVSMPNEASVASQFGLRSLPIDFATTITLRVRPGSKKITIKDVYNQNEKLVNHDMGAGDTLMLLVTMVDGFRYQILNFTSE